MMTASATTTLSNLAAREPIRILVFSASLRAGAFNTKLAALAAREITQHG